MIKIKICGITNADDAVWASNFGADYIGLNFYSESPRKVSPKLAKDILAKCPPFITTVGIFVNETPEAIAKILKTAPCKMVQLHGDETPEVCLQVKNLGVQVIKAVRLQGPLQPDEWTVYTPVVDFFLFDTFSPEVAGGTGETFNWEWLARAGELNKPWFLSGGLRPSNIAQAIKAVHPPAVDVCSGVEKTPKRKDVDVMKTFIQTVRSSQ